MPEQIIIALDCDNFYVAVARALDPRLHRIPVGITQKSLLATVSYEARALGLGKLQNTREAAEVVRRMGGEVVRLEDLREEHLVNGDGGDDQHRVIISPTTDPSPSCQTQTRKKPGKKAPRPLLVLVNGSDLTPFRRASKAVSWIVNTLLFGTTTPSPSNPPSPSFRSESPTRVNSSSVKAPLVAKRVKVEEGLEPAEEGSGSGDEEGDAEDAMHIYSVPMTSPDRAAAAVVRERTRTTLKRKRQGTTSKATSTAAAAAAEGNAHVQAQGRGEKGRASGCGCEKLGLDEVFIDVTALVDAHLASPAVTNERGETFFRLPRSAVNVLTLPSKTFSGAVKSDVLERGFWYPPSLTGHSLPQTSSNQTPGRALIVASHLCAFLRLTIREKTGLTTSGGVAGSKMLAKLISSARKPDGQTVWIGDEAQTSEGEPSTNAIQEYLDPLLLRAIPGFGTHVIISLISALALASSGDDPTAREITVQHARASIQMSTFTRLFPRPQATTLYNLLHGRDPSPVRPTPEYPLQLSVEDSYAASLTRPLHVILAQMLGLVKKLLERLEEELVGSASERYSNGIMFSPPSALATPRTWQRYPTQFRVTLRTFASTNSQSAPMPAFIFDTRVIAADRAERVMRTVGKRLCCALLPGKIENEAQSFEVYVINVAATHLSTSAPPPSIGSLPPVPRSRPAIDLSFIAGLPPEMREEMIRENRISPEDVQRIMAEHNKEVIEIDDDSEDETSPLTEHVPHRESERNDNEADVEECDADDDSGDNDRCHLCGAHVFAFAAPAHARWHAQQG